MKKPALPPLDITGRRLRRGSRVRVVGIPDLKGMGEPYRSETESVFRHIRGRYKRVVDFDDFGHAILTFGIRIGRHRGMHSVAIEPHLLRHADD